MGWCENYICLIYSRAYGLYEEGIHVDPEREHVERTLFAEYKQKINIEDETIPDPIDLKVGWIGEENGNLAMDCTFLISVGIIVLSWKKLT